MVLHKKKRNNNNCSNHLAWLVADKKAKGANTFTKQILIVENICRKEITFKHLLANGFFCNENKNHF